MVDAYRQRGPAPLARHRHPLHLPQHQQRRLVDQSAKYHVFVVEPVAGGEGEEELAAVGVWAGVGHGEQAGRAVGLGETLVLEPMDR